MLDSWGIGLPPPRPIALFFGGSRPPPPSPAAPPLPPPMGGLAPRSAGGLGRGLGRWGPQKRACSLGGGGRLWIGYRCKLPSSGKSRHCRITQRTPGRNPDPLRGFSQDLLNWRGSPQNQPWAGFAQIEKVLRKTSQRVRVPARGPPNYRCRFPCSESQAV